LRLLFVTDYYPPLSGGATRAFEQLATGMVGRGHEVIVATSSQDGAPAQEQRDGVSVHRLRDLVSRVPGASADPHRHTPPPFPDPELVWRLRRLIRGADPAVIYTFGWITYSLCAALPKRHAPVLFSIRDYGNICPKRSLVRRGRGCSGPEWRKCLGCAPEIYGPVKAAVATGGVLGGRSLLRRRLNATQSCSRFVEDMVLGHLGEPDWATEIPRYVIPDFRDEASGADVELPDELPREPFILYVGALRQIKGISILTEAYESLPRPMPPLVLIGSRAPDTPRSFPDGVTVLSPVPNSTVLAVWDRALFGVAPSILPEPLGNVIHEGMSRGKPVIGTTPGGHEEMIDGEINGILIPPGDPISLRKSMQRLISDASLRERLGAAARVKATAFAAERVFPSFVEMFHDLAERAPR
jgi:glycosyltransferase involved in cell wall biosynthesis